MPRIARSLAPHPGLGVPHLLQHHKHQTFTAPPTPWCSFPVLLTPATTSPT